MNIDQLKYFCAVCRYQSFSKAAIEMNISQSSLSKQIAHLEKEFDVLLFDRSKRKIALTVYGENLLNDVQKIVNDYDSMINHLQQLKVEMNSQIKIGILPLISSFNLFQTLNSMKQAFPNLKIDFDEIEEKDLSTKIENNNYDILILRETKNSLLHEYHKIKLFSDHLVALVSLENKASHLKELSLNELNQSSILLPPSYTTISNTFIDTCKKEQIELATIKYGRLETLINIVEHSSNDIAISTKKSITAFKQKHSKIKELVPFIPCDVYLYYHKKDKHLSKIISYLIEQS